jgi:hypothetical protein
VKGRGVFGADTGGQKGGIRRVYTMSAKDSKLMWAYKFGNVSPWTGQVICFGPRE